MMVIELQFHRGIFKFFSGHVINFSVSRNVSDRKCFFSLAQQEGSVTFVFKSKNAGWQD